MITVDLVMVVGEFGSAECELMFSLALVYFGIYGSEGLQKTMG